MSFSANPVPPISAGGRTMKAARVHHWGLAGHHRSWPDIIVLESIEVADPGEREILVRVHAAGVGPWDALVRTGNSGLRQTLPLTCRHDQTKRDPHRCR